MTNTITETSLKKMLNSKFFIPYSDVCKHKLSSIKKINKDCFIIYIEHIGVNPTLIEPLLEEIELIRQAIAFELPETKKFYWVITGKGFNKNEATMIIQKVNKSESYK